MVEHIVTSLPYECAYNDYDTVDPNWHYESEFRRTVIGNQSYNFDIHGMSNNHGADINIGTAGATYDLSSIEHYCLDRNIVLDINNIFTGGGRTITKELSDLGCLSIQIEMSYDFRHSDEVVECLGDIIRLFIESNPTY